MRTREEDKGGGGCAHTRTHMHTHTQKELGRFSCDTICADVSDSSDNRQNSTTTNPIEVWACGSGRGEEQNKSMMRSAKSNK